MLVVHQGPTIYESGGGSEGIASMPGTGQVVESVLRSTSFGHIVLTRGIKFTFPFDGIHVLSVGTRIRLRV